MLVTDYIEEKVITKVVKNTQSYTGGVDRRLGESTDYYFRNVKR